MTSLKGDTVDTWVLVATSGFAALPGAPTPDYTLRETFIDPLGDTVIYASGADMLTFSALPTNGVDSIDNLLVVGTNSPTNFAGDTGSVIVPEPRATALLAGAFVNLVSLRRSRE
jgi:hypothetical protein